MDEKKNVDWSDQPTQISPQTPNGSNLEELELVQTNNVRPACFRSTTQEVFFVLTATMAIAMTSLVGGSVSVISWSVGKDLGMTTAEITWVSSASSLTGGAFLLFLGRSQTYLVCAISTN